MSPENLIPAWRAAWAASILLDAINKNEEQSVHAALEVIDALPSAPGDSLLAERLDVLGAVAASVRQRRSGQAESQLLRHLARPLLAAGHWRIGASLA